MEEKSAWVYDMETLINCTTVTFLHPTADLHHQFVIHPLRNDHSQLIAFVDEMVGELIGYNNVNFDDHILNYIITTGKVPAANLARSVYQLSQELISDEKRRRRYDLLSGIKTTDLFLIHHFDNKAKATSLKWIECALGMQNIQEMPHPHYKPVKTFEEIDNILGYNLNDCKATNLLRWHKRTEELLNVRRWAVDKYEDTGMWNLSNASMGEWIFRKSLEKIYGEMPTPLPARKFKLKEIILPYVKFKTPEFQYLLEAIREVEIFEDESKFEMSVDFDGLQYEFALGGLHAAMSKTIHKNVDSVDVKSYYPNLSIKNDFFPRHLSLDFVKFYDEMYQYRNSLPEGPANKGMKEALVCVFGKSNSIYSFLFDPQFTYAITVNGQLLLAMLCEALVRTKAAEIIMVNTDGLECHVLDREMFEKVKLQWQALTKLVLESAYYTKIMIRDVNNYIAMKPDGKLKLKGAYETDKEFHKDQSMKVVANVVSAYFRDNNIDVREFIKKAPVEDLYMFARAKTGRFVGFAADGKKVEFPRTIRYLVTKKGYTFVRETDKKLDKIHKGAKIALFNNLGTGDDLTEKQVRDLIDYNWYVTEAEKLIVREKKELTLF